MNATLPVGRARPLTHGLAIEGLLLPALMLVAALLVGPMIWLVALSFTRDGGWTLANYTRVLSETFYVHTIWLTILVAAVVTTICAVLGYIVAYALTLMSPGARQVCLVLVALPFWTSALVRTYAWIALLQNKGLVNATLMNIGAVDSPIQFINRLSGTYIGMVHLMLPMMIFPLYECLRKIDPSLIRAAQSYGASPLYAFRRVFFPLSMPGLLAGAMLVFILSLGFYITPALLGGGKVMLIAQVIERDINFNQDWGPASALAVLFLASLAVLGLVARALFKPAAAQGDRS